MKRLRLTPNGLRYTAVDDGRKVLTLDHQSLYLLFIMHGLRTFFRMTTWWGFCRSYMKFASKSYGRHGGWANLERQAAGFGYGRRPSYAFTGRVLRFMELSRSGNVASFQGGVEAMGSNNPSRPEPISAPVSTLPTPARQGEVFRVRESSEPISPRVSTLVSAPKLESLKSRIIKARNPRIESPYTVYRSPCLPAAVAVHGGLRGGAAGKWHRR